MRAGGTVMGLISRINIRDQVLADFPRFVNKNHIQLLPSKCRHIFRIHNENKWGNIKVKCVVGDSGVDLANNIQFLLPF